MKKRKRRRERSADARKPYEHALFSSRKPDVGSWASSSAAADRDNLAFGCLYKMDVARYKLHNTRKTFELTYFWWNHNSIFDPDGDVDAFDSKLRAEGRYWSAKYAAMERHKNLKRTRMFSHARPQLKDSVDFIPLIDEGSGGESVSGATVVEESWEDEIFCKTKEFNKITRERPHDEKIWLDFADFLQILEKKISILEKATELNQDSETCFSLL